MMSIARFPLTRVRSHGRRGNTLVLVTVVLVLLVVIAVAYLTRAQGARSVAAAQRSVVERLDAAERAASVVKELIARDAFPGFIDPSLDPGALLDGPPDAWFAMDLADGDTPWVATSATPRLWRSYVDAFGRQRPGRFDVDDAFRYNFGTSIAKPFTNWPDAVGSDLTLDPTQNPLPFGSGAPNGSVGYSSVGQPLGAENPVGNPGFGDSRWLRDLEPVRVFDGSGNAAGFSHWTHLSWIATAENGWRVCPDLASAGSLTAGLGRTLDYTADIAFANGAGGLLEIEEPVALQVPYEQWYPDFSPFGMVNGRPASGGAFAFADSFETARDNWFSSPAAHFGLMRDSPLTAMPNFIDLDFLGPPSDEFVSGTPRNRIARTLADTDGDGFTDALWFVSPDETSEGVKQAVAISVIDNAGMIDVNVASRFDRFGTAGHTPSDLAIFGRPYADRVLDLADTPVGFLVDPRSNVVINGSRQTYDTSRSGELRMGETGLDSIVSSQSLLIRLGILENADSGPLAGQGLRPALPFRTPLVAADSRPLETTSGVPQPRRLTYGGDVDRAAFDRDLYFRFRNEGADNFLNPLFTNFTDVIRTFEPSGFGTDSEIELRLFAGANYAPIISDLELAVDYRNPDGFGIPGGVQPRPLRSLETTSEPLPAIFGGDRLNAVELSQDLRHRITTYSVTRNDQRPAWLRPSTNVPVEVGNGVFRMTPPGEFDPAYDPTFGRIALGLLYGVDDLDCSSLSSYQQTVAPRILAAYNERSRKLDLRQPLDDPISRFEFETLFGLPIPYVSYSQEYLNLLPTELFSGGGDPLDFQPGMPAPPSLRLDRRIRFQEDLRDLMLRSLLAGLDLDTLQSYFGRQYAGPPSIFLPDGRSIGLDSAAKTILAAASWAANVDSARDEPRAQPFFNWADSTAGASPATAPLSDALVDYPAPLSLAIGPGQTASFDCADGTVYGENQRAFVANALASNSTQNPVHSSIAQDIVFPGVEAQPAIMEVFVAAVFPKGYREQEALDELLEPDPSDPMGLSLYQADREMNYSGWDTALDIDDDDDSSGQAFNWSTTGADPFNGISMGRYLDHPSASFGQPEQSFWDRGRFPVAVNDSNDEVLPTEDAKAFLIPEGFKSKGYPFIDATSLADACIVFAVQIGNPTDTTISLADVLLTLPGDAEAVRLLDLPAAHPDALWVRDFGTVPGTDGEVREHPYYRPGEMQLGPTTAEAPRSAIVFGIIPPFLGAPLTQGSRFRDWRDPEVRNFFEARFGVPYTEFREKWMDFLDIQPGDLFGYDPGTNGTPNGLNTHQTIVLDASPGWVPYFRGPGYDVDAPDAGDPENWTLPGVLPYTRGSLTGTAGPNATNVLGWFGRPSQYLPSFPLTNSYQKSSFALLRQTPTAGLPFEGAWEFQVLDRLEVALTDVPNGASSLASEATQTRHLSVQESFDDLLRQMGEESWFWPVGHELHSGSDSAASGGQFDFRKPYSSDGNNGNGYYQLDRNGGLHRAYERGDELPVDTNGDGVPDDNVFQAQSVWPGIVMRAKEHDCGAIWARTSRMWGWDVNRNGRYDASENFPRFMVPIAPEGDVSGLSPTLDRAYTSDGSLEWSQSNIRFNSSGARIWTFDLDNVDQDPRDEPDGPAELQGDTGNLPPGDAGTGWLTRSAYVLPLATAVNPAGGPGAYQTVRNSKPTHFPKFSVVAPKVGQAGDAQAALYPVYRRAAGNAVRRIPFPFTIDGFAKFSPVFSPVGGDQAIVVMMDTGQQSANQMVSSPTSVIPPGNSNPVDSPNFVPLFFERAIWANPFQLQVPNRDFEQIGQVANVQLWGPAFVRPVDQTSPLSASFRLPLSRWNIAPPTLSTSPNVSWWGFDSTNYGPLSPQAARVVSPYLTLGEMMMRVEDERRGGGVSQSAAIAPFPMTIGRYLNRYHADPGNLWGYVGNANGQPPANPYAPIPVSWFYGADSPFSAPTENNLIGLQETPFRSPTPVLTAHTLLSPGAPKLPAGVGLFDGLVCEGRGINSVLDRFDVDGNEAPDGIIQRADLVKAQETRFDLAGGFSGRGTRGLLNLNAVSPEVLRAAPHLNRLVYDDQLWHGPAGPISEGASFEYSPYHQVDGGAVMGGGNIFSVRVADAMLSYREGSTGLNGQLANGDAGFLIPPYGIRGFVGMPTPSGAGPIPNVFPDTGTAVYDQILDSTRDGIGYFPGMKRGRGIDSIGELLLLQRSATPVDSVGGGAQSWYGRNMSIESGAGDPYAQVGLSSRNSPSAANFGLGWNPLRVFGDEPDEVAPRGLDTRLSTDRWGVIHPIYHDGEVGSLIKAELPDTVAGDAEEANLLFSGLSNLVTTRSDTFTVYMRVRSFQRNPITGTFDATDPQYILDDSRFVFVVDRSRCNAPEDTPDIRFFNRLDN